MATALAEALLGPLTAATIAFAAVPPDTQLDAAGPAPEPAAAEAAETPAAPRADPPGSAPEAEPEAVRHSAADTDQERHSVLAYWTAQRMASAEPLARVLDEAGAALPLGSVLPGPPDSTAEPEQQFAARPDSDGERWHGGGVVASAVGKVYLTLGRSDYTCSAAVVRSDNADTVITAGHCLNDGAGAWASNWLFVPGYDDGSEPHGRFTARDLLVTREWAQGPDDDFDFGMAVLNTNGGRHVADAAGHLDIAFDTGPGSQVYSFGYPAAGAYDGRYLHYCSGVTEPDRRGTTASGVGCQMTQGSSGGPFLSGFDAETGAGEVTSVISFKYSDDHGTQYGPRLGSEARAVHERAESL